MTWMDPHPDTVAEFSHRWYDDLNAEEDTANALADRLADHTPFTAPSPQIPSGEDRSLTPTGGGPAARPIPLVAQRDRPPVDCATCHGDGEITFNPGWPDPQCETSATCQNCHGTGLTA